MLKSEETRDGIFAQLPVSQHGNWTLRILIRAFDFSPNVFTEFSDNIFVKKGYSNLQPLIQETKMLPQRQEDTGKREDFKIDPYLCLSDLSDFPNSLNFPFI